MSIYNRLKRIDVEGQPDAIMLSGGGISFRHYKISGHAVDRFIERCGLTVADLLALLSDAVLACSERAKNPAIRRVLRIADERGGYVLMSGGCFFVIKVDSTGKVHVITTVMTPLQMTPK